MYDLKKLTSTALMHTGYYAKLNIKGDLNLQQLKSQISNYDKTSFMVRI